MDMEVAFKMGWTVGHHYYLVFERVLSEGKRGEYFVYSLGKMFCHRRGGDEDDTLHHHHHHHHHHRHCHRHHKSIRYPVGSRPLTHLSVCLATFNLSGATHPFLYLPARASVDPLLFFRSVV